MALPLCHLRNECQTRPRNRRMLGPDGAPRRHGPLGSPICLPASNVLPCCHLLASIGTAGGLPVPHRQPSHPFGDLGGWEMQYMLPYLDFLLYHNMGNSLSRGAGRQHKIVEKSMGRESHTSRVKSHLYHLTSNLGKIAKLCKP